MLLALAWLWVFAQVPPAHPKQPSSTPPAAQGPNTVQRIGANEYRIGRVHVDTKSRVVTVPGVVNQVTAVEFGASTKGGMKGYESAVSLETDAISFNLALVLIGLDRANAKPAQRHFDAANAVGDPVAITFEIAGPPGVARGPLPIEALLHDKSTGAEVPPGEWVYTGSMFYGDGRYAADVEGVLIGFAHTPSSIVESVKGIGLNRYGSIVVRPDLRPGMPLTVRITALTRESSKPTK
jgi:hypothetical protein